MNTLKLYRSQSADGLKLIAIAVIIALSWPIARYLFASSDPGMGIIESNIWLLIITALMCFILLISTSWWLIKKCWMAIGLPALNGMVSQFHTLELWQQFGFYWLSFALLVLAGVICLTAIC